MQTPTSTGTDNLFADFAEHYDRMINWNSRFERETPFYQKIFTDAGAKRVLDIACGTGRHAILFSSWGLEVCASDASEDMIITAKNNAREAGVNLNFKALPMEESAKEFSAGFDVVTCMGNSLPHIRTYDSLRQVFDSVSNLLKPKGIFAIQIRNYRRVQEKNEKYMPLNTYADGVREFLYLRVTEPGQELVKFSIIVFRKDEAGKWSYEVKSEELKPWIYNDIETSLTDTGFTIAGLYGGLDFSPFNPSESVDLVITAQKKAR